jgi:hypothetical protein
MRGSAKGNGLIDASADPKSRPTLCISRFPITGRWATDAKDIHGATKQPNSTQFLQLGIRSQTGASISFHSISTAED